MPVERRAVGKMRWMLKHFAFCLLEYIGMRDRLRCPYCKKVGTWKPHSPPRRWLCKWCGLYEDIDRIGQARPCKRKKVWMLKPLSRGKTPAEMVRSIDPWRG